MKIIIIGLLMVSVVQASNTLNIQNVLEIPGSLESVTNVSQKRTDVLNYYNSNKIKLPKTGTIEELTASGVLATLSYASLFCQRMIMIDSALSSANRWAHAYIDFNETLSKLNSTTTDELFHEYALMFWQRDITAEELAILNEEFAPLVKDLPDNKDSVIVTLTAICSAFSGSLGFLAY